MWLQEDAKIPSKDIDKFGGFDGKKL